MCHKLSPKTKMASFHWYRSLLVRNPNINDKAVRTWNRTWVSLRCSITFGVRTVQLSHHRHSKVCCTMLWLVQNWDSSIAVSPLSSQEEHVCSSKLNPKWFDKQRKHCGPMKVGLLRKASSWSDCIWVLNQENERLSCTLGDCEVKAVPSIIYDRHQWPQRTIGLHLLPLDSNRKKSANRTG